MSCDQKSEETVAVGFRRGEYQWRVRNVANLKEREGIESKTFFAGGKKWALALLLWPHNCGLFNVVKVLLISRNGEGIGADVDMKVVNDKKPHKKFTSDRKWKVATSYDMISRHDIMIDQLTETREFKKEDEDELIVTVGLKNIRDASYDEQQASRIDIRTIVVEVICEESIKSWLNCNELGLVELNRVRHSDVCSCSLVRAWALSSADHRYWLCKRNGGNLTVQRCLSHAEILERFDDICEDDNGGHPWVTVFAEHKNTNETFEPIDKDTFIMFCKFFDSNDDPSYLGCLHVKGTMDCLSLFAKIVTDLRKYPEDTPYNAYVEKGDHCVELTSCSETLDKMKIGSGSVVILTERGFDMNNIVRVDRLFPAIQAARSESEGNGAQNPAATNTLDGSQSIEAASGGDQLGGNQETTETEEDPAVTDVTKQLSAFALGPKSGIDDEAPPQKRSGKMLPIAGTNSNVLEITKTLSRSQGPYINNETLELPKHIQPDVQRREEPRQARTN